MTRHRGRCHCGAIRFAFDAEPASLARGVRCNCSICSRKGAVMSVSRELELAVDDTGGVLQLYRWGDEMVNHYFCGTCGIYPFHSGVATPGRFRVNLGCVEGIDVFAIPIDVIDGRARS